eukprot:508034_1
MKRGYGVGAIKKRQARKEKYKSIGQKIEESQLGMSRKVWTFFKENLEKFAIKHKKEINSNPLFRTQFQQMCTKIGVDPLASSKGFWGELLGMGDFYYELGVQIIDICFKTRQSNGGLIRLPDLQNRLKGMRGSKAQELCEDDIKRAISKVSCLGNGFRIIVVGSTKMVVSVPCELNRDHTAILKLCEKSAFTTSDEIQKRLHWPKERVDTVLKLMLQEGMAWIDLQVDEQQYWFPSLYKGL